jgi:hypothetical protein
MMPPRRADAVKEEALSDRQVRSRADDANDDGNDEQGESMTTRRQEDTASDRGGREAYGHPNMILVPPTFPSPRPDARHGHPAVHNRASPPQRTSEAVG